MEGQGVTEARFRAFADQVTDAFYLHDEHGTIVDVNQQACESLGYSREELIGMMPEQFDADIVHHSKADIMGQLKAGKDVRFDTYHRRKDGSVFPAEVRMRPFSEGGRMLNVALVSDISERKRTESTLRRLNRELIAISSCTQVLMRSENEQDLLDDLCKTICDTSGYRMAWVGFAEHDAAKSVRPVAQHGFTKGYLEGIHISWANTKQGGGPTGTAIRTGKTQVNKDFATNPRMAPWRDDALKRGYHSSIALPLKIGASDQGCLAIYSDEFDAFADDEVKLLEELAVDLSFGIDVLRTREEHRQAESALRASEERYRTIFQNSAMGIFRSTIEGRFLELNPAMAKMLGYDSPAQALREITDIGEQFYIHAEDRQQVIARQLRGTSDTGQHFCHYKRRDGKEWFANLYLKTIRDAEGKPVFFDGIIEDITERVKAEQDREKLQEQLLQAQKMESVGRLAGGIAHDFNNILSVIIGYTELAMRDKEDSKRHAHLEQVRKAAHRSVNLTRQLLGFARKQIVLPKVLDLNETVESLLKLLQRLIGEDITLVWQPGEGLGLVNIDPSQFDQILTNLAVNARDAIEGQGTIRIETRNADLDAAYCDEHPWAAPGSYVLISFSDNGHGMDKEIRAHAFEPFFTTKELGKGTGLGLATVYGIIKQNKGFIDIDSARGQGTTISIYLPRYADEHVQSEKSDVTAEGIEQGHETILIVEDEIGILQMAKLVLEQCGYQVLTATSAKQAMRQVEGYAKGIQLLVTDVVMPEMNGRELANHMLSLHPEMRCLYMSGYSGDTISRHGVLDEGVHFIQKPFSTSDLTTMVRRVLDGG